MSLAPLRLVLFDATQAKRPPRALGWSWSTGARLYRALGWIDGSFGATSFDQGLEWLLRATRERALGELQFWGHGKWGRALIAREALDRSALSPAHALRPRLEALRERLSPEALLWFRTCETLGASAGQDFARSLADFTGARVAGHTFEIGYWQSGLRELAPGTEPTWDACEGLAAGTAQRPERALPSGPDAPSTITCFTSRVPGRVRERP
jgi:hypothetical protein